MLFRSRIMEMGTHQELLGQDGLYSRLYRIQYSLGNEFDAIAGQKRDAAVDAVA